MESVIAALKDTPIPTLLLVAGIVLLLLSIAGQLAGRIAVPPERQRWAAIIGSVLLVTGLALQVFPAPRPSLPSPSIPGDPPTKTPPSSAQLPPKLTSRQLAAIDEILVTLPLASIAFNAPTTLRLGDSTVIHLLLSMRHSIEQLQAMIVAAGEREGASIRVSPQMEARLSGLGFKIEAITQETQAVSEQDTTEWRWEIEATRLGTQYLHLSLSALLYVADDQMPRTIRTFQRTIEVTEVVEPWSQKLAQFVKDHWQWLWTSILIPIVLWIISILRKRRKRDTSDFGLRQ